MAIEPGTRYDAEARIWEGDFFYLKAHQGCNQLAYKLWAEGDYSDDEGIDSGIFCDMVREEYREHHDILSIRPSERPSFKEMLDWVKSNREIE